MAWYFGLLTFTFLVGVILLIVGYIFWHIDPVDQRPTDRRIILWGYGLTLGCWAWPLIYTALAFKWVPRIVREALRPLREKT